MFNMLNSTRLNNVESKCLNCLATLYNITPQSWIQQYWMLLDLFVQCLSQTAGCRGKMGEGEKGLFILCASFPLPAQASPSFPKRNEEEPVEEELDGWHCIIQCRYQKEIESKNIEAPQPG